MRCAGIAARSGSRRGPARADGRQRDPRLAPSSAIRAVQDPYCLRCQPQVMGAALDLLRQAAATLADEANGVSDNPLIFAEDDEALSGGNFHAEPVAFAADMIALAMCEIGSLAERRIAMLVDPALSGLPAFLTPKPGPQLRLHDRAGDGRGAGLGEQAARLSGQRRFDPDLGQSGGSRVDGGAWRAAALADGRERVRRRRHRAAGGGAGLRLSRAAALERAAGGGARAARARRRRISTTTATSTPTSQRRRGSMRDGAVIEAAGEDLAAGSRTPRDERQHPDWLAVSRGDAPLIVSIPHAGVELGDYRGGASSVRGSRARTPTGGSTTLRFRRRPRRDGRPHEACRARSSTSTAIRPAPRSIPARRRPSSARPRRSTASRSIAGQRAGRERKSPSAGAACFDPYHAALRAEIARLQGALRSGRPLRRPLDPLAHSAPVRRRAAASSISGRTAARAAARSCGTRSALRSRRAAQSFVVDGRFRGGWITRHYGKPGEAASRRSRSSSPAAAICVERSTGPPGHAANWPPAEYDER